MAPSPRNKIPNISYPFFGQNEVPFRIMIMNYIQNILGYRISVWKLVIFWHISYQIQYLLEPSFFKLDWNKDPEKNEIRNCYYKACLVGSHYFMCIVVTNKNIEPFWVVIWFLSGDMLHIVLKDDVYDVAVRFYEDIPLELCWIFDSKIMMTYPASVKLKRLSCENNC